MQGNEFPLKPEVREEIIQQRLPSSISINSGGSSESERERGRDGRGGEFSACVCVSVYECERVPMHCVERH